MLKDICEGIGVPLPYKRGNENELREAGGLLLGLRRHLARDAKAFLKTIEPLLDALSVELSTVLNTACERAGSRGG